MSVESSPQQAALAAYAAYTPQATSLVSYESQGRLLIVGDWQHVQAVWPRLPDNLTATALLLGDANESALSTLGSNCIRLSSLESVQLSGYLGAFVLAGQTQSFDLVLNLESTALFPVSLPPPGAYQLTDAEFEQLPQVLAELSDLMGVFDKPKYFQLNHDICAHSRSAIDGCDRCLQHCGSGAIQSLEGRIQVDPQLCQGLGDCSSVCPAGAINYVYPRRSDTLNRIRQMLRAYWTAGGEQPVLLFHDEVGANWLREHCDPLPESLLLFEVESPGSVGLEIWLAALAYGADRVALLDREGLPAETRAQIPQQMGFAREILAGMGYPTSSIALTGGNPDSIGAIARVKTSLLPAAMRAQFAGLEDKRTVLRIAIAHLYEHAPRQPEVQALGPQAPFGSLAVNTSSCTLCMACVSMCPEQALKDNPEQPQLKFFEANCVQCGLCQSACPEQAITLEPRYLYDFAEARRAHLLHEEIPFECIRCGKPFATARMIDSMTEKLRQHPMFQGEGLDRLKLCGDCKIAAQFSAPKPDSGAGPV